MNFTHQTAVLKDTRNAFDDADEVFDEEEAQEAGDDGDRRLSKRLSVERLYQKKSQKEHILLRPDTYIGSTERREEEMWVLDGKGNEAAKMAAAAGDWMD